MRCGSERAGTYVGASMGAAVVEVCTLIVMDKERRTVTAEKELRGPEPPPKMPAGQSYYGPPAVNAIIAYLARLPPSPPAGRPS